MEDSKIFFTYLPLQPSEQHNWLIERGKDTAPTMILDPSRAGEEVALVGQAADDNGRQLEAIVHHSSVSSAHIAKLLSIHSERGTRNAWDLEIEIVNG